MLAATTAATGYLFAEVPLVSTGGAVFEDTNGNGQKDTGRAGHPERHRHPVRGEQGGRGHHPKTATTDASGELLVHRPDAGHVHDRGDPAERVLGWEGHNGTPAGTVTDNRFMNIDLTKSAAAGTGFNFGEVKGGILSGVVFKDLNNDGTQAATGEPASPACSRPADRGDTRATRST